MGTPRSCAWCRGAIAATARRDSVYCSKRCRQASHRFTRGVGAPVAFGSVEPIRLAYADPPYPGKSGYYVDHPDYGGEVDHADLVSRLQGYDGWALSTSAESLQYVLGLCPPGTRVAAWHRGERPNPRAIAPQNAWEPVLFKTGRSTPARRDASATAADDASSHLVDATGLAARPRRIDSLVYHSRPRLTDPNRVIGSKPAVFASWMFELLGALPGDTLDDLYPGSGAISRAWELYTS